MRLTTHCKSLSETLANEVPFGKIDEVSCWYFHLYYAAMENKDRRKILLLL